VLPLKVRFGVGAAEGVSDGGGGTIRREQRAVLEVLEVKMGSGLVPRLVSYPLWDVVKGG
jgi:hypothetical protein